MSEPEMRDRSAVFEYLDRSRTELVIMCSDRSSGSHVESGLSQERLVWRDISHWTVIEKINANRDCTLGLLMVSPAQRVGAYV